MAGELKKIRREALAFDGNPQVDRFLAMAESILGCDWGRKVAHSEDISLCNDQAVERICVHINEEDVEGIMLKLCAKHAALLSRDTETRPM